MQFFKSASLWLSGWVWTHSPTSLNFHWNLWLSGRPHKDDIRYSTLGCFHFSGYVITSTRNYKQLLHNEIIYGWVDDFALSHNLVWSELEPLWLSGWSPNRVVRYDKSEIVSCLEAIRLLLSALCMCSGLQMNKVLCGWVVDLAPIYQLLQFHF